MTDMEIQNDSPANNLCKSCGLCCTGHLFAWTKLRSAELDSIQSLGLKVHREPQHRGFSQPCPLWDGVCTVYTSPQYPRFCQTYKCKLLKQLLDGNIPLPFAQKIVGQAMDMIRELESLLPASLNPNFRERIVKYLEHGNPDSKFRTKADELLGVFNEQFGVDDFFG